ncbi:galactose mutarotase [Arthrobacter sp. JZ12]|uniref:aldose 1-epimerase family protein n=1 Tax=Arthrobacter sp. JZ12 TaxID=2654190 RepID=UPI002B46B628|nr:aldose 1-epimerase family protein [Arthrobacter sp. JZ12]WRH25162.1 galactose mutarotase [Arthrobacter sp. JZ12]
MKTTDSTPLSGTQYTIEHGPYTASIASVGASLRYLRHDNRDLVVPYDADEIRPSFRGAVLVPWPNRVVDGKYSFNGVTEQLAITEPQRNHAIHGLLGWVDWTLEGQTASALRLSASVVPQKGYPFRLEVEVLYSLDDDGLTTTITAVNPGPSAAPYGSSAHPYLVAGEGLVDDWTLEVPASSVLQVTEDRLIPTDLTDVSSSHFDFREPRLIGSTFVDHAYTNINYDGGAATVAVRAADGRGAAITFDEGCPWVQIHTADKPDPAVSRLGLAAEPMTCPPDAFNSGTDLLVLEPGDTHAVGWRIHAL